MTTTTTTDRATLPAVAPTIGPDHRTDTTDRAKARAAAADRAKARKVARLDAIARGLPMFTRANIEDTTTAARSVANRYALPDTLVDAVVDDIAAWLGRPDRPAVDIDRFRAAVGPTGYAARLARKAGRYRARRMGTGKGSMARLKVPADVIDSRMAALYGPRAYTLIIRDRSVSMAAARPMSDGERALIHKTQGYERGERAPNYAQWRDGAGNTVPVALTGHNYAAPAPGRPERDSGPMGRGTLADRLDAIGTDADTIRAAVAAVEYANTRTDSGRFPARIGWAKVADRIGAAVVPANVARGVRGALARLADVVADVGPDGVYCPPIDTTTDTTTTTTIGTGRFPDRFRSVALAPMAPMQWVTVGPHIAAVTDADGAVVVPGCPPRNRPGYCRPGCDAIRLLSVPAAVPAVVADRAIEQWHAATDARCPEGHPAGCPPLCPTRVARRRAIARRYAARLAGT